MYERISHNMPINNFYQLCRKSLEIRELIMELEEINEGLKKLIKGDLR